MPKNLASNHRRTDRAPSLSSCAHLAPSTNRLRFVPPTVMQPRNPRWERPVRAVPPEGPRFGPGQSPKKRDLYFSLPPRGTVQWLCLVIQPRRKPRREVTRFSFCLADSHPPKRLSLRVPTAPKTSPASISPSIHRYDPATMRKNAHADKPRQSHLASGIMPPSRRDHQPQLPRRSRW
jgi:hypothetical protein